MKNFRLLKLRILLYKGEKWKYIDDLILKKNIRLYNHRSNLEWIGFNKYLNMKIIRLFKRQVTGKNFHYLKFFL